MNRVKKLLLAVSVLAVLSGSLAGCNTVQGMGQDLQAGSDAVSNTVNP